MTSIYKASDDSMHEQREMKSPYWNNVRNEIRNPANNEIIHYQQHLDTLRVIPCAAGHSWEDGKEYVEGKDYKIDRRDDIDNDIIIEVVIPCSPLPSNEDELWEEYAKQQAIAYSDWKSKLSPVQLCTVWPPVGSGGGTGLYNKSDDDLWDLFKKNVKTTKL